MADENAQPTTTTTTNNVEDAGDIVEAKIMNTSASGNVAFELVLSPAAKNSPSRTPLSVRNAPDTPKTLEHIQEKLQAAAVRKMSLESQRKPTEEKLAEAAEKRAIHQDLFKKQAEQELQNKMESLKENREKFIEERVEKIKEHDKRVEEVLKKKEAVAPALEKSIEDKLQRAEELRNMRLEQLQEKLKKQDERVQEVRTAQATATAQHAQDLNARLAEAESRRDAIIAAIKHKQQDHEAHASEVRSKLENGEKGAQEGKDKPSGCVGF